MSSRKDIMELSVLKSRYRQAVLDRQTLSPTGSIELPHYAPEDVVMPLSATPEQRRKIFRRVVDPHNILGFDWLIR